MQVLTAVDGERMTAQRRRDEFFWLDLASPSPADFDRLRDLLGLHEVALEDTREFGQRPKVDVYQDFVLLVFYTARLVEEGDRLVEPIEVHVYVSGHWIVTVRRRPVPQLDELHDALVPEGTEEEDYLVYRILDGLTDAFYPAIAALEERIDALEGEVLERTRREHLGRIYRLKQEVREIERRTFQQHARFDHDAEAILALPGFQPGHRRYLNDVRDHLEQASVALTRQVEDLHMLTGTFYNANSQKLNVVVARLSIVASFFLVWTLLTSFFGQNFGWLVRSIDSRADFLVYGVGGLVVSTLLAAAVLWRRRNDLL
jgi:magnesium transporter